MNMFRKRFLKFFKKKREHASAEERAEFKKQLQTLPQEEVSRCVSSYGFF